MFGVEYWRLYLGFQGKGKAVPVYTSNSTENTDVNLYRDGLHTDIAIGWAKGHFIIQQLSKQTNK